MQKFEGDAEDHSAFLSSAPHHINTDISIPSHKLPTLNASITDSGTEGNIFEDSITNEEENIAFERDEEMFLESPTLQCLDEADVALDMDGIPSFDLEIEDAVNNRTDIEENW